ncbi:MAG: hypothetical protein JST66_14445 [Bacteroidetes bacterium]|nr:hypothetical protein [Bacteroidota bacterium]
MNTNWSKILLFSLLFGILGFVLGRMCGSCHRDAACGREGAMECHGEGHGKGACCKPGEHHGMAGDTVQVVTPGTRDTVRVVQPH